MTGALALLARLARRAAGWPALLRDIAATSLALILHESATNAAKYGALSVPGGKVTMYMAILMFGEPGAEEQLAV